MVTLVTVSVVCTCGRGSKDPMPPMPEDRGCKMMEAIELVFQSQFPDASNKLETDEVNEYQWLVKESSIRYMTHVHN